MSQHLVLQAPTRVDGSNAPELQTMWLTALEQESCPPGVVIDLGQLEYISSAGLRVFLVLAKAARQRGTAFALAAPGAAVADVLQISGFDRIMTVRPSVAQAMGTDR